MNSHLIVGSCATLVKAFSLCALFFRLSDEGGSSLARLMFICLVYLCDIFVSENVVLIVNAVPIAVLNQALNDYKIYQSS